MNFSKQLEEVNKNRRAVGKPEVKMTNRHIEMLQILREAPETRSPCDAFHYRGVVAASLRPYRR